MSDESTEKKNDHVNHFTVNDEPQETPEATLTPLQIMKLAGVMPEENYLVQIKGRNRESFQGRETEPIHMDGHPKFVTVFTGAVTVS